MNFFYIPCPDHKTAEALAQTLLEERWIACANILPSMNSLYWWKGKVQSSQEALLIIKTDSLCLQKSKNSSLEDRIRALHPYEIPCLLQLEVKSINSEFENWIHQSFEEDHDKK